MRYIAIVTLTISSLLFRSLLCKTEISVIPFSAKHTTHTQAGPIMKGWELLMITASIGLLSSYDSLAFSRPRLNTTTETFWKVLTCAEQDFRRPHFRQLQPEFCPTRSRRGGGVRVAPSVLCFFLSSVLCYSEGVQITCIMSSHRWRQSGKVSESFLRINIPY